MLNTGGMRGRQKRVATKGRLVEEELLLAFERERALGLLCSLVFEGDITRRPRAEKEQISGVEVWQEREQGRKRADCSAI